MSAPAMSVAPHMASANPGGHMMPFPNMSKESLDQMFKKFQQMKQDGSFETDPDEFTRLRGILTSAKHYSDMQKQRQQFQKHQQLMQNGTPNQTAPNGFRLPQSSPENLPPNFHTASTLGPPSDQSQYPAKAQNAQLGARSAFSEDQAKMLRSQMMAFKLLSRDAPLPPDVQKAVFRSQHAEASPTPSQALASMGQAIENGQAQSRPDHEGTSTPLAPARTYKTFTSPQTYLQPRLGYDQYSRRKHRPIISSLMPPGIDIDRAREERENIVYNRIVARKAELEKLNANVASWDTSKSDTPVPDTSIKLKALIEYKMLTLLPKQRALRQSISREMVQADNLAMTANRSLYRRQKKQSLREARITERIEKQQREARVSKEKKKHDDYLHSIAYHKEEMHRAAKEQRARTNRLGRLMITQHQIIEKEEQKRVERTAKQRLQALKANDEETYLKLLGQAKDSRISHLLKQTDGFLTQLAASVKDQQRSAVQKWGNKGATPELPEEDEEIAGSDDEVGGKKVDYYEVAHRVKEHIHGQSSNLIGGELKEYQLKGLQWMISLYNNNLNGILADEMGLGKTIQTISFITYLIEKKNQNGPFLVIVPLSTLTNWNSEFEKWAPSVKRIVYKGPPQSRKQCAAQMKMGTFQVVLTTYEFIIKDRPVLSKVKWLHMTVDEGHRMKNSQSKLSFTITNYYSTRFRLILTGTPLQNNLPELWALLNFVLPNIFKSVKSFDEWFNTPFANTGGQDKMDLTEEEQILVIRRLHKVLRPFLLRRLKKDVEKDLPDKQERVIKCSFSALQTKLYRQLVNHNRLMVSDGKGGKTGLRGLSNMLMQLRKLCNHPFVFEEVEDQVNPHRASNDLLWRTAGKFELLDRILPKFRATGHRVLMFFQMTQIMNIMEDFMRLRQFSYLRLDGSTKSDERAGLLKEFNREDSPHFVFLLSTRAGGLGLNLQAADTVIIFDSDWNPHQDLQAQDRAHRIGQRNEVRILRLISSNSVEEKILERAQFKLDMDGKVIQAGKFDNKSTNEERDAMLRVMLESAEAAEELETEEMGDEDLNMLMLRNEGELEIFQEFDAERARHPLYGTGKKFPRLMGESELPDIYVSEDVPEAEPDADEFNFGRGARERTRVKYDDGLTEEQWLDAVDNDEDSIENAIARKQEKKQRRAANKEKRIRVENGDLADTPPPPDDDSGSPVPRSKRRGRKPGPRAKRTADDASLDSESVAAPAPPPRKRGRQAKPVETLNPDERDAMQSILDRIYESLNDMEATSQNDDGEWVTRGVTDAFLELPSKALYPDYYYYITQPIAMEKIKDRINRKEYQGLNGFAADIRLMCSNCRTYNEDASPLWHDANLIETTTTDLLSQETAANSSLGRAAYTGPKTEGNSTLAPSTNSNSHQASATPGATNGLANGVDGGSGSGGSGDEGRPTDIDGQALGSNSSEGAQTQPVGTPKLKLNFGGGGAANATTNGS